MSLPEYLPYYLGGDASGGVSVDPPEGAALFSEGALSYVNHLELGASRLIEQLKRKPKIEALLLSWLVPVQEAENVLWSLKLLRGLYTSTGAQLDCIGELVGEPDRRAETDARYRVRIIARIAVNLSDGRREDILSVAALLLPDGAAIYARDLYPASALYQLVEPSTEVLPLDLYNILRAAGPGGVNVDLTYSTSPASGTFVGGSSYGDSTVASQWPGTAYDASAGGYQAATFG